MDPGLSEKVILVTGATAGLGLATAGVLLAEGARVVISSRTRHAVDRPPPGWGGLSAPSASPRTMPTPIPPTGSSPSR